MAEERITEVRTPQGDTHTTHTVTDGTAPRSGGGASWAMLLLLALALVAGFLIFTQMSGSEIAKDTAVADAASDVSEAASSVGEAAENAGAAAQDAVQN